jgi:hypothetical protein
MQYSRKRKFKALKRFVAICVSDLINTAVADIKGAEGLHRKLFVTAQYVIIFPLKFTMDTMNWITMPDKYKYYVEEED